MTQQKGQGNVAEAEGSSGRGGVGPAPTRLLQEGESSSASRDEKAAAAHRTSEQAMKKGLFQLSVQENKRYSSRISPNCSPEKIFQPPQPRQPVEEERFQVQHVAAVTGTGVNLNNFKETTVQLSSLKGFFHWSFELTLRDLLFYTSSTSSALK